MKPSKYLEKFQQLANRGDSLYRLRGDYLLVERIPDEEIKTKSGIIIAAPPQKQLNSLTNDQPNWVRVLVVGAGYYKQVTDPDTGDVKEEDVPLDAKPGDICLVSSVSVRYFPTFLVEGYEPFSIGITKDSEIQLQFLGEESYWETERILNPSKQSQSSGAETQMEPGRP